MGGGFAGFFESVACAFESFRRLFFVRKLLHDNRDLFLGGVYTTKCATWIFPRTSRRVDRGHTHRHTNRHRRRCRKKLRKQRTHNGQGYGHSSDVHLLSWNQKSPPPKRRASEWIAVRMITGCRWHECLHPAPRYPGGILWDYR